MILELDVRCRPGFEEGIIVAFSNHHSTKLVSRRRRIFQKHETPGPIPLTEVLCVGRGSDVFKAFRLPYSRRFLSIFSCSFRVSQIAGLGIQKIRVLPTWIEGVLVSGGP